MNNSNQKTESILAHNPAGPYRPGVNPSCSLAPCMCAESPWTTPWPKFAPISYTQRAPPSDSSIATIS